MKSHTSLVAQKTGLSEWDELGLPKPPTGYENQ